jgi:hypothetical protein
MVKRKVRLKITTTSRRIVRLGVLSLRAQCPACGRDVEALTRSQAAGVLELDERALERLVADGRVHAIPMVSGNLRVCKDSLFTR